MQSAVFALPGITLLRGWVNRRRTDSFGRGKVAAKVGEVVRMDGGQVECTDE